MANLSLLVCTCLFIIAMASKRRRLTLEPLIGLKGISDSALAAVLHTAKQQTNIATPSRRTIGRMLADSYSKVHSLVRVPMGGHEWDWDIARLDYMLRTLCEDSVQFRSLMAIVIGASTDQVLTVITYLDEVIPGNVLNPDNARNLGLSI